MKVTELIKKNISQDFAVLTGIFLMWRFLLFVFQYIAINHVPLGNTDRFLGGGSLLYSVFPEIFSWANYDGEHYLSIAIIGYRGLEQAFFPVYPSLIRIIYELLSPVFPKIIIDNLGNQLFYSTIIGLLIANIAVYCCVILLWRLVVLDYSKKIANLTITSFLLFPTSFYLVSLYNESLFLLFVLTSFYLIRTQKKAGQGRWFLGSVVGIISSATRIFGILLLPSFLLEMIQQKRSFKNSFWILFVPLGLLLYMGYQWKDAGDPLAFYNLQKIVGEQHQSGITLLPQVYYRYTKMLFTVNPSDSIYITIAFEYLVGLMFFVLPIYGFSKKMRMSYVFYALVGFLIPTIQGSFSSVPRYILAFFPSFIALGIFLSGRKYFRILYFAGSFILLMVFCMMFLRGYWVA
jgi:hypothetical protein